MSFLVPSKRFGHCHCGISRHTSFRKRILCLLLWRPPRCQRLRYAAPASCGCSSGLDRQHALRSPLCQTRVICESWTVTFRFSAFWLTLTALPLVARSVLFTGWRCNVIGSGELALSGLAAQLTCPPVKNATEWHCTSKGGGCFAGI